MKKSKHSLMAFAIGLIIPVICIAGPIYDDARQQALALFDKGEYHKAIEQFIAIQEIAPVFNDLSDWILKCNKQIAIQNNQVKSYKKPRTDNHSKTVSTPTVDDGFVVYDSIGRYNDEGIALAMLNGKYGYVNRKKEIIVPVKYENTDIFGRPETISVGDNYRVYYRDTISYKGDWKGIAMSVQRDGKWGFVNKKGDEIIPCKFYISESDSLLPVGLNNLYGFIDLSGNIVIPLNYEFAGPFSRDVAPVVKNGKLGFINKLGDIVIDLIYDPKYEMHDGKARIKDSFWLNETIAIRKNGKWGLINIKGEEVYPFKFDEFVSWSAEGTGHGNLLIFMFKNNGKDIFVFNGKEYLNEETLEGAKLRYKADMGEPKFIYDLAAYYWNQGEYNPSSVWAEKGDILGHAGCSRLLGAYWLFCTDTPSLAEYYLLKAAEDEDDIAQYYLGLMYEENIVGGGKKSKHISFFNREEAIKWYKKSASHGNQMAKDKLTMMGEK